MRSWILQAVLLVGIIGLLLAIAVPNYVHSGPGKLTGIVNVLRQIDAAKQEWAIEHGITNITSATNLLSEKDIAPLLSHREDRIGRDGVGFDRNGYPHSGYGEKYVVNRLGISPEAQLTRELKEGHGSSFSLPKGTIIRLGDTREEIILPSGTNLTR